MACIAKIKHDVSHCTTEKGLQEVGKSLVAGVGVYKKGKYECRSGGKLTAEYALWSNMLSRVYSPKTESAKRAYGHCTVSENFKSFQYFSEWCNKQIGFGTKGCHLDKDILSSGAEYSEDVCVFVPQQMNKLLTLRQNFSGNCALGVCFLRRKGKFLAQLNKWGFRCHLGYFETEGDASSCYKTAKELYIKEVAEKYRSVIDQRVYLALLNWEV